MEIKSIKYEVLGSRTTVDHDDQSLEFGVSHVQGFDDYWLYILDIVLRERTN